MKESENKMSENRNHNTVRLAKMGMLVAIAIVLVYFIHFPIFPAVAFLEYDPADIPILMGTFAFGPVAGILLTVVTAVIQGVTVSAASGLYGIIMHIISTSTLVIVAGVIYQKHKTRKTALIGLVCGVLAMTIVMIGANMIITPLFMGVPRNVVWQLMPFIAGFNAIKAGINGIVTFLLYKRMDSGANSVNFPFSRRASAIFSPYASVPSPNSNIRSHSSVFSKKSSTVYAPPLKASIG